MKRILSILLLFVALTAANRTSAQLLPPNQPEQDACDALVLCGSTFTTPFSYQGEGQVFDLTTTPCASPEANSMWLRLNVNTAGIIVFDITPFTPTDDYDFAVVNITNSSCNPISQSNVIRCNFNNNSPVFNNGALGLNTTSTTQFVPGGSFGQSYLQQINANPGDIYLIMVNNFGSPVPGQPGVYAPSNGFTINFTGSTATFNQTTPSMDYVIPSCNNSQQVTLQMVSNMKCNSIAPDGSDFTVSGGGSVISAIGATCLNPTGYTNKITLSFASPLPAGTYTLGVQNGSDNNTILDLCNSPIPLTDTIQFIIPPYTAPQFVVIDTPACSEIRIKMNSRIRCDSLAKNGSDFAISGPQASNVIGAYGIGCDTLNFTDTVVLLLQTPLQTDGVYTITAKKGTDNNTTMDSCGLYQPIGDAITLTINSYDGLVVSSKDSVLCQGEYVSLNADNFAIPPFAEVTCDTEPTVCNGNMYVAFVGTKDSSTDVNTPFPGAFQDAKAQYLYRASELRAMGLKAGSIRILEWKVTQKLSTAPFSNFTVRIGCTPLNDINSNFISSTEVVYSSPSFSTVAGWNTIALSTPYNWDGTSNLVVEVCYDNTSTSSSDRVAHSATNFSSVMRRYGNGLSGCAITTEGTAQSSTTMRPRLRFHICEPPAGQHNWAWTPGTFLSDSTIQQPVAFINRSVTYGLTTIDRFGCAHRDSSVFTLSIRQPELDPLEATICVEGSIQMEASGGVNYTWLAEDPATLSCLDCPDPVATPVQTSVYNVIISDQYNCADTLTSTVHVNPLPPVNIHPEDLVVKYGTDLQLTGSGAYLYSWSPPGSVSDPNITNPVAHITRSITLYLTGIDERGCHGRDSLHVTVDYSDPTFIPSAFSPNGDGKNDVFRVGSMDFQKLLEFRVFNRWGQEVFSTTDPLKAWDGTYKGVTQEIGVYHYVIRVAYPDAKVETYKGDITLIR